MYYNIISIKYILLLFIAALMTSGCATTNTVKGNTNQTTIVPSYPDTVSPSQKPDDGTNLSKHISVNSIKPFASHVEYPVISGEMTKPEYSIQSGTDDDGVWVEGKGYFKRSIQDVYRDLTDPMVIGPVHMTKDITMHDMNQTPEMTTYVMDVKMRYIMSIEFELSAKITPLYNDEDQQTGWFYISEKTSGTRFLSVITTMVFIQDAGDGWFKVEFKSLNKASMNKEDESRGHLESLFNYWQNASAQ